MKSEIRVSSGNTKLQIIIGVCLTVIVIFLSVWFRFEVSIILLSSAGVIAVAGAVVAFNRLALGRIEHQARALELATRAQILRQETYKADRLEAERLVLNYSRNERLLVAPELTFRVIDPADRGPALLESGLDSENLRPVMDVIAGEPCVCIYGARDAGKTTLALHWIACQQAERIVIDPKPAGLNSWPTDRVIGCNGRMDEIEPAVSRVYAEVLRRQELGLLNEPAITLLVDELFTLTKVHKLDIMQSIFAIIALGRQYRVNASFTSSAKGVKALEIEGMSGLSESLAFVHVVKVGEVRKVYCDLGEGEFEVRPPGPYIPIPDNTRPVMSVPLTEDEQIARLIQAGLSDYKICEEIWRSRNDKRYERINVIRQNMAFRDVHGRS